MTNIEDDLRMAKDDLRRAIIHYENIISSFNFDEPRGTMETNNIIEGNMHLLKTVIDQLNHIYTRLKLELTL
jgi:hypothetical protein